MEEKRSSSTGCFIALLEGFSFVFQIFSTIIIVISGVFQFIFSLIAMAFAGIASVLSLGMIIVLLIPIIFIIILIF